LWPDVLILNDFLIVSTVEFRIHLQIFKCVQLILFVGGDGDLFPVNSLMGYLSGDIDCLASGLAVYAFYGTHSIIFFLIFCTIDNP
jgi:hypothetical protein